MRPAGSDGFSLRASAGIIEYMGIDRTIRKTHFGEQAEGDTAFWMAQPPQARIDAVRALVYQYYGLTDETWPRLERVYRIVKRPRR